MALPRDGNAVDPGQDGVEAGRDEGDVEDVVVRVRPLVRGVAVGDDPGPRPPLVGHRFYFLRKGKKSVIDHSGKK